MTTNSKSTEIFVNPMRPSCRDDVAAILIANRDVIRARIRRKLSGSIPGADRDVEDLTASVLRRIDLAILRRTLKPVNEREFWAYVVTTIDNTTFSLLRRSRARVSGELVGGEVRWAQRCVAGSTSNDATAELIHAVLMALRDEHERELFYWKLAGWSNASIAAATGETEWTIRARWARLCRRLRQQNSDSPSCPNDLPDFPVPDQMRGTESTKRYNQKLWMKR